MFEVSSFRTHTSSKSSMPLINSHVDSRLFRAAPDFNQPLLQFFDGVDFCLVYTVMQDSPDQVVNWIEVWTVWRPQVWRNEVRCFWTQIFNSIDVLHHVRWTSPAATSHLFHSARLTQFLQQIIQSPFVTVLVWKFLNKPFCTVTFRFLQRFFLSKSCLLF